MIKKFKRLLLAVSTAGLFLAPITGLVTVASAVDCVSGSGTIQQCVGAGTCLSTDSNTCDTGTPPGQKVNDIIKLVINVFSLVVGVVAVIMIILGGLKYITSGGDSGNVSGAKNTILYAVIGLVVVALAQVIVRFVLNKVTTPGQ